MRTYFESQGRAIYYAVREITCRREAPGAGRAVKKPEIIPQRRRERREENKLITLRTLRLCGE